MRVQRGAVAGDGLDTRKQAAMQKKRRLVGGKPGRYFALQGAQSVRAVRGYQIGKHRTAARQQLARRLQRQQGVVKVGRLRIGRNSLDFGLVGNKGGVKCRHKMLRRNRCKRRNLKRR